MPHYGCVLRDALDAPPRVGSMTSHTYVDRGADVTPDSHRLAAAVALWAAEDNPALIEDHTHDTDWIFKARHTCPRCRAEEALVLAAQARLRLTQNDTQ